jgi:hypothetical protein
MMMMSHFESDISISAKITAEQSYLELLQGFGKTTIKIQNTILKIAEPIQLQIQL